MPQMCSDCTTSAAGHAGSRCRRAALLQSSPSLTLCLACSMWDPAPVLFLNSEAPPLRILFAYLAYHAATGAWADQQLLLDPCGVNPAVVHFTGPPTVTPSAILNPHVRSCCPAAWRFYLCHWCRQHPPLGCLWVLAAAPKMSTP